VFLRFSRYRPSAPSRISCAGLVLPDPIFIGGSGRCGTTLVARVLAQHPNVALVPTELRVHSEPGGLVDAAAGRVPADWLAARLRGHWKNRSAADGSPRGLTRLCPVETYDQAVECFVTEFERDPHRAGANLVETLVAQRASDDGTWVEMSPPNCAAAEGLLRMFPTARFVHVLRSGLDVACSYRAQPWAPDDLRDCMLLWGDRVEESVAGLAPIAGNGAVTVRLEDIVANPESEIPAVSESLRLPAETFPKGAAQREVRRDQAHIGRWRDEIDSRTLPTMLALYVRECQHLRRVGLGVMPADLGDAAATWQRLPRTVRIRAAFEARRSRWSWRRYRRRRWRWHPPRRLRWRGVLTRWGNRR
jgi:Sulfotransferase family